MLTDITTKPSYRQDSFSTLDQRPKPRPKQAESQAQQQAQNDPAEANDFSCWQYVVVAPAHVTPPANYPTDEIWAASPHQIRAVSDDAIAQWDAAKRWNTEIAHDLGRFDLALANKIRLCQQWIKYRWTTAGHPTVFDVRRCNKRNLCPVCILARSKSLRTRIDLFARDLLGAEGGDLFVTLLGRGNWSQFSAALNTLRNHRSFKRQVSGACFGRHITESLSIHAHSYLETDFQPDQIDSLWRISAKAAGITHARTHSEPVRNRAASIAYILRPMNISGIAPDTLLEMFAEIRGKRSYSMTGTFREYWTTAKAEADAQRPNFKAVSRPLGYQWDDQRRSYRKTRSVLEHSPY